MKNRISKLIGLVAMLLCVVMCFSACSSTSSSNLPTSEQVATDTKTSGNISTKENPVKISLDEWIGWWTCLAANGGLKTAPDSINAKNGIYVEYVPMNDPTASSSSLIAGELVGAGYTVNRYAFLQSKFDEAKVPVVMPFITNFSNGGDGIIAKSDIINVRDLVGKKIAVPRYSEAQTLVEWLLNNSDLTDSEKKEIRQNMVFFETADDTAKAFFSGTVDAAATWEPYLTQAASSTDSRILFDTSMSTNLILDGILFRQDFVDANETFVVDWIDGILEAASLYKNDFASIRQFPMFELMTDEEIIDMANGADLALWKQNHELLNGTAITMYSDMANVWITIGETAFPDKAKTAFTDKYMEILREKYEGKEESTVSQNFNDDEKSMLIESPDALLSYNADIKFELNSTDIRQESYAELDEFVKVAQVLDGVYIQIEGNASQRAKGVTDEKIIKFSEDRAHSVEEYFVSKGISRDRIIVVGNGDSNPLNKEDLAAAENRRTEIFFKTKMGY